MKAFATTEWGRAGRSLRAAQELLRIDADSAASRAYYAAFHALTALFALRGLAFTRHAALRAALHRDLVQKGVLGVEMGKAYDFLMTLRATGDYGGADSVTTASAKQALDKAAESVAAIGAACPELANSGPGGISPPGRSTD